MNKLILHIPNMYSPGTGMDNTSRRMFLQDLCSIITIDRFIVVLDWKNSSVSNVIISQRSSICLNIILSLVLGTCCFAICWIANVFVSLMLVSQMFFSMVIFADISSCSPGIFFLSFFSRVNSTLVLIIAQDLSSASMLFCLVFLLLPPPCLPAKIIAMMMMMNIKQSSCCECV